MVYAPIIIATLNRFEHFKRCIESLEQNPWAQYTDIYISVDYPPEDRYREGHRAIVEYIKKHEFKFKKAHLYFQEYNLGSAPNKQFLREIAFKQSDRIISLEDDMEVSPNFIEYMDKALEAGKEDEKIYSVSSFLGWIKLPKNMTGTVFKEQGVSWGFGVYREKRERLKKEVSAQWLDDIIHDRKKIFKLFLINKPAFYYFINNCVFDFNRTLYFDEEGNIRLTDLVITIYMIMNDMYNFFPAISKSRNWGMDGSGQNCGKREDEKPEEQDLDIETVYDFRLENNKRIKRIIERRWHRRYASVGVSRWQVWKALFYYFYLNITHRISSEINIEQK